MPNVPTTPGYEEFEEVEDGEDGVEYVPGGASGDASDLGDHLLGLIGELHKLEIQLLESDEDAFRVIGTRLARLRAVAASLPTAAAPRRRVGFRPPVAGEATVHEVGGVVISSKLRPRAGSKKPAKRGKR